MELKNKMQSGLVQAKKMVSGTVNDIKSKISELKTTHVQAIQAMKDQIPGLSGALSLLANPYALIIAGVVALGAAFYQSTQMNLKWQEGLAKTNVTAQLGKRELAELSDQLLIIGKRNPGDLLQVPETFNKIISAGLDVNTALRTLEPTLKAAKAGFVEAEIAASSVVSVMNSSGVMDANRVYDILFATLNKGNAEFKDIANYLPKIVPGARQAGVSLEQVAGAYAFLTAQGLKAEFASTSLSNAFKALSTPDIIYGSKTKGGFKSLGIEIFNAEGKMRDMIDIVTDLNKVTAGLSDEQRVMKFASIGLDQEAAVAFSVMSQDVQKFKETIDFTTASQGQLNEAVKNAKQPMDGWKLVMNELHGGMVSVGEVGSTWFGKIGDAVYETIQYFKKLWNESDMLRDAVAILGKIIEATFYIATAKIQAVWNIFTGLLGIVGSLFGMLNTSDGWSNFYLQAKPVVMFIYQYIEGIAKMLYNIATFDWSGVVQTAKDLGNAKSFTTIQKEVFKEHYERKYKVGDYADGIAPVGGIGNVTKPDGTTTKAPGGKNTSAVTGSQSQSKTVNIQAEALVKVGDLVTTNPEVKSMNKAQLEQWFFEMMTRALRNIETSYQ